MATPEPGTRVRKTTETEILPPASSGARQDEFYDRDFWELIGSLTTENWREHMVRIYRADERWENAGAPAENKFTERFNEETIRAKWGGGRYNMWLYGPPHGTKLVCRPFRLELEGLPKTSAIVPSGMNDGGPLEMMLRELLAEIRQSRGGDLTQGAMKNALEIQFQAQKQAIEMIASAARPAAGPSPFDDMFKTLITALVPAVIAKFTNPANPIEEFKTMAGAVREALAMMGGGKDKPNTALDTLMTHLPSVMDKALTGVHEYRLATESQERSMQIRAKAHTIDMPPVSPAPTPAADGGATPAPSSAVSPGPQAVPNPPNQKEVREVQAPSLEWVLLTIVDKIENVPDCDGEDLFDWLRNIAPPLMEQLAPLTREQVIELFATQPILQKVITHPRLPKMIDEFLAAAKEWSAADKT